MTAEELREKCAAQLLAKRECTDELTAFIGLDGFVDDILKVVNKRESAESFEAMETIAALANRIHGAIGKSTNIELVPQRTKLGGNGPIMANALASLNLEVTYLGALGYPTINPVFEDFTQRTNAISICEPGYTNALEFEDGKIMMSKTIQLNEVSWPNIVERYGKEKFEQHFHSADLVGFVNWTMIPYMSELWESILSDCPPPPSDKKRYLFFDLADPEKRENDDILQALELISKFQKHFNVILGLNEKESHEIADVLSIKVDGSSKQDLATRAEAIFSRLTIDTLVVHPVAYALIADKNGVSLVDGPFIKKPVITTGAGDHFNAGFCFGRLLGFDNEMSLLTGVSTSGYYVATGKSPTVENLAGLLQDWPKK